MDLIYTDASGKRLGVLRSFTLDLAYGEDENDMRITLPLADRLPLHGYAYIDGTEWGGVVDGDGVDAGDVRSPAVRTYTGRTWHGILAGRVVVPDGDYYVMSGEANAAIRALLEHIGLGDPFAVPDEGSGFDLSYQVPRFADAYAAVRGALASAGARLAVERRGGSTWLSAVAARTVVQTGRGSVTYKFSANARPVNHLVCAGEGELSERVVVHLYADEEGNVSRTQTLFGVDEVAAFYDSNNADEAQLAEDGTKKLKELWEQAGESSLTLPDREGLHVGDSVAFRDHETGFAATSTVTKVVASVPPKGRPTVSYETGGAARPVSMKG